MRVGVIGGGINGVMISWALARRGHQVALFERNRLMSGTSSASTRLLHGGLRYLEHGEFKQVAEGLNDRSWWLERAPHLAHPIPILYPLHAGSRRARSTLKLGLWLYDRLAGKRTLGNHTWMDREAVLHALPGLHVDGLRGAYRFWDGQMDDLLLGLWAADQARTTGVEVREEFKVLRVDTQGGISTDAGREVFDRVVNVAGPWAQALLEASGISSPVELDLVRGSHILIDRPLNHGLLVEVPGEARICFILPYQGRTLVGTTEVRQSLDAPAVCSSQEHEYLRKVYNHFLTPLLTNHEISGTYAGIRPLVRDNRASGSTSRESVIHNAGKLINVFGGKWTTSRSLGERIADLVDKGNDR